MARILVIDDSAEMQELVSRALASDHRLEFCSNLAEARSRLGGALPELILLDVVLPDGEGFQLCSELQNAPRTRDVPVVLLSSRTHWRDKITGFGLGADDYVEKPFHPEELRARIAARLRKQRARSDRDDVLVLGPLRIDRARLAAFALENGAERDLGLTPHEFQLLHRLARRPGHVLTRAQLLHVMCGDTVVSERTVDTHVSNLRRKLGQLGTCLQSVRGVGYRFVSGAAEHPSGELAERIVQKA